MPVGGLALIHGAVGRLGVVQHYCVAQNPSVGRRRVCRDTRHKHTHSYNVRGLAPPTKGHGANGLVGVEHLWKFMLQLDDG